MSTTPLRPLAQSLKKLAISKPGSVVVTTRPHTNYALMEANLPRKIGIHGQPRIFHSPRACGYIPPPLRHRSDAAKQKRTHREGE